MIQYELPRGLLHDLLAVILGYHGERQIDAGGDAGRTPDIAVAHEGAVGLELDVRIGREEMPRALPMRGGAGAGAQGGLGVDDCPRSDACHAKSAVGTTL